MLCHLLHHHDVNLLFCHFLAQEELKEVFDGSCDLIPIKLVAKECRALFDEVRLLMKEYSINSVSPSLCQSSWKPSAAR